MSSFKSPAYNVKAVPVEKIVANSYNPNVVAPPEMKLLELSIWEDGYTMPLVCYYREEEDIYELVDGYHRYLVMKTSEAWTRTSYSVSNKSQVWLNCFVTGVSGSQTTGWRNKTVCLVSVTNIHGVYACKSLFVGIASDD